MKQIAVVNLLGAVLLTGVNLYADEKEKRETLSTHETVAVFQGSPYRLCRGRTARCPGKCGHSGEFASFRISKYLSYKKPGKYGDAKQETYSFQISDFDKNPQGDPMIFATVKKLKKGDRVLLSWKHDYVTKDRVSSPERHVTKFEMISAEKARKLLEKE